VDLASGASLVLFDALSAGRSHRNERWGFRRYSSGLRLAMEGAVVLDETVLLDPEHGAVAERLGRFDLLATLLIAGSPLAAARAGRAAPYGHLRAGRCAGRRELTVGGRVAGAGGGEKGVWRAAGWQVRMARGCAASAATNT